MYLDELISKLNKTQTEAKDRLLLAKEKSKRLYDLKLNSQAFQEGDEVFLLKEPRHDKMDEQYAGRYKILELYNDVTLK